MAGCERYGVSEAATAELYNEDMRRREAVSDHVMTQSQAHRLKKKFRMKRIQKVAGGAPIALSADERQNPTKMEVGTGAKGSKRFETKKQEHCAIILYPEGDYVGHVVPEAGSGSSLAKSVQSFSERRKILLTKLRALITDGCMKMVGWRTGFHAALEKLLGKPLHRIICEFHHLEKSFEKILLLYAGHTTSPTDLALPIGKSIKGDVHKLPVAKFEVMAHPLLVELIDSTPEDVFKEFNNDHQVFVMLIRMVASGTVDIRWFRMRIGQLLHSRWTTTQARSVREYLSDPDPSFELKRIVFYLVYCWAEVFIRSRHKNTADMGPRLLLLETILGRKHLTMPERMVVLKSLSINGQYCHSEAVLLTLAASPVEEERKRAVRIIMKIRERGPQIWDTPTGQRPFMVSRNVENLSMYFIFQPEQYQINPNATSLLSLNLIPLGLASSEPPLTRHLSGPQLMSLISNPLQVPAIYICTFIFLLCQVLLPANSVAVERGVKLQTRAATVCADPDEQDGFSLQTMAARERYPIKDKNFVRKKRVSWNK